MTDKRLYKVLSNLGVRPATGDLTVQMGSTVELDDAAARFYLAHGLVEPASEGDDGPVHAVFCPLCAEQGRKRPPKFSSAAELAAHYDSHHPGFVVPDFNEGGE